MKPDISNQVCKLIVTEILGTRNNLINDNDNGLHQLDAYSYSDDGRHLGFQWTGSMEQFAVSRVQHWTISGETENESLRETTSTTWRDFCDFCASIQVKTVETYLLTKGVWSGPCDPLSNFLTPILLQQMELRILNLLRRLIMRYISPETDMGWFNPWVGLRWIGLRRVGSDFFCTT